MLKRPIGELFAAALLRSGAASDLPRFAGVAPLLRAGEREVWEGICLHVRKHGALPSPETAERDLGLEQPSGDLEPASYYHERLRARHVKVELQKAWKEANEGLRGDPLAALEMFTRRCFDLSLSTGDVGKVLRLQDAEQVVVPRYAARGREAGGGLSLGWKALDDMSGGLGPGDVLSIIGRPGLGKTMAIVWAALNAHQRLRQSVLFVSPEMDPEQIMERCVAVYGQVPLAELRRTQGRGMTSATWARFKRDLGKLAKDDVPFHIVDGNVAATVQDVCMLVRQLRPAAVFIDGAYLLGHPDKRLNAYQRVEVNSRSIKKDLATGLGVPVVCAYQFNRDSEKGVKKGERPTLAHIAGSDAIGQDSSVVLGLFEDDSVELLEARTIHVLKGRNGEVGEWKVRWDWEAMDFGDYVPGTADDFVVTSKDATKADAAPRTGESSPEDAEE